MDAKKTVSLADFQRVATPMAVRGVQVVHLANLVLVSAYTFAVVLVYYMNPSGDTATDAALDDAAALTRVLSLGVLFLATTLYGVVLHLYPRLLRNVPEAAPAADPAMRCFARIRTAEIMRLALLEAPALFGLVVCFLATLNGVLQTHPVYWLNTLPVGVLIAHITLNFPTPDRFVTLFRTYMTGV